MALRQPALRGPSSVTSHTRGDFGSDTATGPKVWWIFRIWPTEASSRLGRNQGDSRLSESMMPARSRGRVAWTFALTLSISA